MSGGWYPDPTGRFGQRWYDGHRWTDQVVAANGTTIEDPLPEHDRALPPPFVAAAPAAPPHPPPARAPFAGTGPAPAFPPGPPGPPGPPPLAPAARPGPGATLVVGLFGLLLVALSVFGVPWSTEGPGFSFLDLGEAVREADGDGEPVVRAYAAFGGFVLVVGALIAVVLAGIPLPRSWAAVRWWRIAAAAGCGLAAVLHTVTVVRVFRGPATPEIGAWLGTAGYLVALVAMVIGHHRRRGVGRVPENGP